MLQPFDVLSLDRHSSRVTLFVSDGDGCVGMVRVLNFAVSSQDLQPVDSGNSPY